MLYPMVPHRGARSGRGAATVLVTLFLLGLLVGSAPAQPARDQSTPLYELGIADRLQLSVWQMPELDRLLTVDENGNITVPMIGEVRAEGRNVGAVEAEIIERIQVFHRNITRVSIEVTEYNSRAFYVLGAVTQPGKYTIWPIPNVWQAIREAGGLTAEGDLSQVRVYRQKNGQQVLEHYDIESILSREGVLELPTLASGETVEVPRRPTVPANYQGRDGVYVFGEVLRPGVYRLEAGSRDMLGFILQAGGFTEDADLNAVLLLRTRQDGSLFRFKMNLNEYLADADSSHNPSIRGGDTIFVPRHTQVIGLIRSNLAILTTVATLLTSVILLRTN